MNDLERTLKLASIGIEAVKARVALIAYYKGKIEVYKVMLDEWEQELAKIKDDESKPHPAQGAA